MKKDGERVYYFVLAAIMMLILFVPGWAADKFLFGLDTFTMHLPFLLYAKNVWSVFHDLPLWMPDIFMGMPAIDSANLMYFYPTNLLSVILPVPAEQLYLIDIIIHMAAAGFGMFLFLRLNNIEKQASYFGAFVYMFSGPLVTGVYNGHWPDIKAIALVPYVFYFINRAINEKNVFFYLSAGLFMALQVMGIGMQVAAYTYIGIGIYAGYLLYTRKAGKKETISAAVFFALMTAAIALFSAPQFFPSQDYMRFSWRQEFLYEEFINYSFNPRESIVFLLPKIFGLKDAMYWGFFPGIAVSFYCGLLPFLLAPFALFSGRHRNPSTFFIILAVFFLIMAFGGYTPFYKILYHIPVFNKFRNPARILCMLPFVFSFLAAAGLSSIIDRGKKDKKPGKIFKTVFITAAISAGTLILAVVNENFLNGLISGIFSVVRSKFTSQPMPGGSLVIAAGLIRQDVLYFTAVCGIFCALMLLILKNKIKSVFVIGLLFCLLQFFDMQRVDREFISYETIKNAAPIDQAALYMKNDRTIFRAADLTFVWIMNSSMYHGLEFFAGYHAILHNKMYTLLGQEVFKNINIGIIFQFCQQIAKELCTISSPSPDSFLTALLS